MICFIKNKKQQKQSSTVKYLSGTNDYGKYSFGSLKNHYKRPVGHTAYLSNSDQRWSVVFLTFPFLSRLVDYLKNKHTFPQRPCPVEIDIRQNSQDTCIISHVPSIDPEKLNSGRLDT